MKITGGGGGVSVRLRDDLTIVSVIARKDQGEALAARCGLKRCTEDIWHGRRDGPGGWSGPLAVSGPEHGRVASLRDMASLSDHSGGYAVFEIWGPAARAALAKGVPVDLHLDSFIDDVAVTVIAHIDAIVWHTSQDRFAIAVFRSYAESFWYWLTASAAEFGLTATTPNTPPM